MDGKQIKHKFFTIKDIVYIAMLTTILFVQEEVLTFIPNVQFTIFLLVLYSKKMGFTKTTIIILIHVFLDNLVMGSLNFIYTPVMFFGWMFIPIFVCTIGRKTESPLKLGLIAILCSFLYCWSFVLPTYLFMNINPLVYLGSDIIFELILAVVGFTTTFLLYKPCSRIFEKLNI